MSTLNRIDVSDVGEVSRCTVQGSTTILDEPNIQEMGPELFGLVDQNRFQELLNSMIARVFIQCSTR